MMTNLLWIGLLLQGAGAAEKPKDPGDDKKALEGVWVVVGLEDNGEKRSPETLRQSVLRFTFKENGVVVTAGDSVIDRGTVVLRPAMKPKQLDIKSSSGPVEADIYELNGDTLKFCLAAACRERPNMFAAPRGTRRLLYELKREK